MKNRFPAKLPLFFLILAFSGCGSGSTGSGAPSAENPQPAQGQTPAQVPVKTQTPVNTPGQPPAKPEAKGSPLLVQPWCNLVEIGSSATHVYRQIIFNENGSLTDTNFKLMSADRTPSKPGKIRNGSWSQNGAGLRLVIEGKAVIFLKAEVLDAPSGKVLRLYEQNEISELFYACKKPAVAAASKR